MSFFFKPENFHPAHPVALYAGLALLKCLQRFARTVLKVKWPNDIYCDSKKLAGILVEQVESGYIVGIGLNFNIQYFPDSLEQNSVSFHSVCNTIPVLEDLVEQILAWQKIELKNSGKLLSDSFREEYELNMFRDISVFNKDRKNPIREILGLLPNGSLSVVLENFSQVELLY